MIAHILFATLFLSVTTASASDTITATTRTNAQNYKDRALASCIASAYKGSAAGEDADITKSAFLEWTYYDDAKGNPAVDQLVEKFLRRNYANPVEGYAGAQFKLLKCLDMYHSKELAAQVRQYVPHPDWVGDKPAKRNRK